MPTSIAWRRERSPGQQDWKPWPDVEGAEQTLSYDQYSEYFNTTGTVYYWRVAAVDAQGSLGRAFRSAAICVQSTRNNRIRLLILQTYRNRFRRQSPTDE